jgi:hypothetical protein
MKTYIKPSRYLTAKKREQLYLALEVFTEELFDGSRLPKVDVIVSVRGTGLEDHVDGYCHVEEQYDNGKPKEIYVEIRGNRGLDFAVKCLAHEFVHVWQMCTGRLQRMTTLAAARTDYKNQPWEVEAFELEDPLYELYLKNS